MKRRLCSDLSTYPVQPKDIDGASIPCDSFGTMEREISAQWILRFCQRANSWNAFKLADLQAFYNEKLKYQEKFWFNGLDVDGFVVVDKEREQCQVTHDFVARYFLSSPAQEHLSE